MKSIWMGRSDAVIPEDMVHFVERHPEAALNYTKLVIFYDKPLEFQHRQNGYGKFVGARVMCEVPNYMFPEIHSGEFVEFKNDEI